MSILQWYDTLFKREKILRLTLYFKRMTMPLPSLLRFPDFPALPPLSSWASVPVLAAMPLPLLSALALSQNPDVPTVLTELKAHMQSRCILWVCAAINHVLKDEPSLHAMLLTHAHRTVLLRFDAGLNLPWPQPFSGLTLPTPPALPAFEYAVRITDTAMFEPIMLDDRQVADVTLTLQVGITTAQAHERLRFVRIEGDALLAQALSTLAAQLRWDVAHDLAKVVGDAPAYWVAQNAQALLYRLQAVGARFKPLKT
jgi:hypothetical protein